jgi:predicted RNase H-like HicB family nuclease
MAPVTVYTAICEREDGWWVVTVPELESGRTTQARALAEVPATVADLVATMTGADPGTVEVHVHIPEHLTTEPDGSVPEGTRRA